LIHSCCSVLSHNCPKGQVSNGQLQYSPEEVIRGEKYARFLYKILVIIQVQQGRLKRSDLADCLKMLFPLKSEAQLEELINQLHDPEETVTENEEDL